jgi:hypothetical protein
MIETTEKCLFLSVKMLSIMKVNNFFIAIAATTLMVSCVKHEVIPPPKPQVDLSSTFFADTSGTTIQYTKDVDGFYIQATNERFLQSSPQLSSIVYFNTIRSTNYTDLVKFSVGKALWDAAAGPLPTVSQFKLFFEGMLTPAFSDNAENGIVIEWVDRNGQLWISRENSTQPQSFVFTSIVQESDEEGDYVKFSSEFSCWLYSLDNQDSVRFDNGRYTSYFQNLSKLMIFLSLGQL